jgi:death-on-curing protein
MRYLSLEEILVIHARIVDETGGSHGVRDTHLLGSMVERPKMQFGGNDLYPTLFDKTAAYFESAAFHDVFVDGNKRTAIALAARFLFVNGYELLVLNKKLEKFVLNSVIKKYDVKKVADWLKVHSQKIRKQKNNKSQRKETK